jgi:hypothetical protein
MKRKMFVGWLVVSLGTFGAAGCTGHTESQPPGPEGVTAHALGAPNEQGSSADGSAGAHGGAGADRRAGGEDGTVSDGGTVAEGDTDEDGTVAAGSTVAEGGADAEGGTVVEGGTVAEGRAGDEGGTDAAVASSCSDGIKNGNETGVDCGGSCPPCANSKDCKIAGDCQSGDCKNLVCMACATNADCATATFCDPTHGGGSCTPQKTQGVACTASSQCASVSCVSGVCCDTACAGLCQACSSALKGMGADGVCGNIGAGNDSLDQCVDQGAASCDTDGKCDGNGACQIYASGTVCVAAYCGTGVVPVGSAAVSARTCDGAGTCTMGSFAACLPYLYCNGPVCAATCVDDTDCTGGGSAHSNPYCNASRHCVPGEQFGEPCTAPDQCSSGNCTGVDGGAGTCE